MVWMAAELKKMITSLEVNANSTEEHLQKLQALFAAFAEG